MVLGYRRTAFDPIAAIHISNAEIVMDRGVMGVQVPHVNSAEDARRAVAAVKFGAGAARGLAAGTRPDSWGLGARMPDFTKQANVESLAMQTEFRHGMLLIRVLREDQE